MNIEILIPLAAIIFHTVFYFRSSDAKRLKKLFIALSIIGAAILFFIVGLLLGLSGNYEYKTIALVLIYSPTYLPLLSFFVYLPKRKP